MAEKLLHTSGANEYSYKRDNTLQKLSGSYHRSIEAEAVCTGTCPVSALFIFVSLY